MDILAKQAFVRQKAQEHQIKWSRHALGKLAPETVSVMDVEAALQQAEVIEEYPHLHRRFPDCLVLAFVSSHEPIHCVIALNEFGDYVLIVTVYRPVLQEWKDDWRTRRK